MGDFGGQITAQRLCRGLASVALATAALVAGAAPAGAHGGDADKVHGCVNGSGQVKIVAAGGSCLQNDISLDWPAVATSTTYSAGFGLALSSGNVFSVTGAPWSGLTGVPAGFADGGDDDGGANIAQLKTQLATDDGTPNGSGDLVSFTKIKDLVRFDGDGAITGGFIQNGTIFSADIAEGGVTSEDLRDGTIEKQDLAAGVLDRQVTTLGVNPQEAPAGSRVAVEVTMPSASVSPTDLVTVSPPATLENDLLFAGSDVLTPDVVTIYLHNLSGAPVDGAERTWTIRRLRTGG